MPRDQRLPDAELELLASLSRLGDATVRDLQAELAPFRPMAAGSVITLLNRLESKGMVRRRKGETGKAFIYSATARGQRATKPAVRALLDRVFAGSAASFVSAVLDAARASPDELREIERIVRRHRRSE